MIAVDSNQGLSGEELPILIMVYHSTIQALALIVVGLARKSLFNRSFDAESHPQPHHTIQYHIIALQTNTLHFRYVYTCAYLLLPKSLPNSPGWKLTNGDDSQSSFTDLVIIDPQDFSKCTVDALEDQINTKYANKVVYNVGLCICLWDILKVSEGMVGHGSGSAHVNGK